MADRFNKPKVFLSHSWENKPFIKRIADDLRRCSIDYWLDTEEIRDGRSWLKMIFEDGIPKCDAVIVYLTEQSIRSPMVQKELDAAVLHQLSAAGVNLLPYVSEADLRKQLRSDIQTLQCREWNEDNYESVFPTVVAEIWRSYLERTVEAALLHEKNQRLEQELENKRLKEQYESAVFSAREEEEFRYFYERLSRKIDLTFSLFKKKENSQKTTKVGEEVCRVSVLSIVLAAVDEGELYFDAQSVGPQILKALGTTLNIDGEEVIRVDIGRTIDQHGGAAVQSELNTFGLTTITPRQDFIDGQVTACKISEKMYRFKFWIEYNSLLKAEPLDHVINLGPKEPVIDQDQVERDRATAAAMEADNRISQTRRRKAWSTNGEGSLAVTREIQSVFDALAVRVKASNEKLTNIKLKFYADLSSCTITANEVKLSLKRNCPTNNIADYVVSVVLEEPGTVSAVVPVVVNEFVPEVNNELLLSWHTKGSIHDVYTFGKIADYCWRTFFGAVQRNEEERT